MEPLTNMPHEQVLRNNLPEDVVDVAERFWSSLWVHYIRNKGSTSLPYWAEQFQSPKIFNQVLILWKEHVISVVVPERSWAEVRLNEETLLKEFSPDELTQYRKHHKVKRYLPEFKDSVASRLVRSQGEITKTGLVRTGFRKAANTQYYYDTATLQRHKQMVINDTTKSMRKLRETMDLDVDDAAYDMVATEIVQQLAETPYLMTQGNNFSDSRGRAIKESLGKVANPIGYKSFRALLTIPE